MKPKLNGKVVKWKEGKGGYMGGFGRREVREEGDGGITQKPKMGELKRGLSGYEHRLH